MKLFSYMFIGVYGDVGFKVVPEKPLRPDSIFYRRNIILPIHLREHFTYVYRTSDISVVGNVAYISARLQTI